MEQIMTIAVKEFRTAFKDKLFLAVMILFLLLSILSVYIGSATKNAELTAYHKIIKLLKSQGATNLPGKPQVFPLAILRNIIKYVGMIGAVLAIFLGFNTFSGEREQGTLKLLLTRPLYRDQLLNGKLLGGSMVIGLLLIVTLIFNVILFITVSGMVPNLAETGRLLVFFVFAFYYMLAFYLTSLFVSIKSKNSAYSFLLLLIIWTVVSFVIPQLAESQKNYAYVLNNISQTMAQLPTETLISRTIEIFSPMVQFQNISRDLLQVVPERALFSLSKIIRLNILSIVYLLVPGIAMLLASYISFLREGD